MKRYAIVIDGPIGVGGRLFLWVVVGADPYRFLKNPFVIDRPIGGDWRLFLRVVVGADPYRIIIFV